MLAKGVSVRNTLQQFKKTGSVFVPCKNPWSHLHPRHLVKDYKYEAE